MLNEIIEFIKVFFEISFGKSIWFGIIHFLSPILGIYFLIKSRSYGRWQELWLVLGGFLIFNFILFTLIIIRTVLVSINQ